MAFDLGALVTRMQVLGQREFEQAMDSGGASMGRAAGKAGELGKEVTGMSAHTQAAVTTVGAGMLVAGVAIAAMVGLAVSKYTEYDKAISKSAAVTGAYGEELAQVRDLTQELGASTVFTATEAAQGVTELGKAGVSTSDILGGALRGSLALAAAGETSVADAAAVAATTLNQFNLRGEQTGHVADLIAAAAGKAQGSVGDLSMGLKQSGLVASQMGLSVEESVGSLAAFASAGLIGSDAGTSFRTMLLSLANPSSQASAKLKEINVEAYDAQGNFVGIANLAGQLKTGLAGSTQAARDQALAIIFGSDAIRAANVLYNEGEQGIKDWTNAVDDSGYAARLAAQQQDNLAGDLEKLGGAFDTALIKTGAGADGVLRDLIQTVTDLIDGFGQMPPILQQIVLAGGLLAAGFLLVGGAALIAIPRILEMRAALATIRTEMPLVASAASKTAAFLGGPWGIAIAAAIFRVEGLTRWLDSLKASSEEMQSSLTSAKTAADIFATAAKGTEAVNLRNVKEDFKDLDTILQAAADQSANVFARFDSSHFGAFTALKEIGTELSTLAKQDLPVAQRSFNLLAEETDGSRKRLWELLSQMPDYKQALIEQATQTGAYSERLTEAEKKQVLLNYATGEGIGQTQSAAAAYIAGAEGAGQMQEELSGLLDLLNEQNDAGQKAITTTNDYQAALDQADAAIAQARAGVEGFTLSLDAGTEAGRNNRDLLVDLGKNAWAAAEAQLALDGNAQTFTESLQRGRQEVIDRAIALGANADEASRLADQIIRIPSEKQIEVIAQTTRATQLIDDFVNRYQGKAITMQMFLDTGAADRASAAASARLTGAYLAYANRAQGGIDFMAGGGIKSNAGQLAQIRRAGDVTVWAEHDTGGEAYIPFAQDRRGRSEAILGQVAGMFGGTYIPAGARGMAAGGVSGDTAAIGGGAGPVNVRVFIGETELRVIAREEIDEATTDIAVAYIGGSN